MCYTQLRYINKYRLQIAQCRYDEATARPGQAGQCQGQYNMDFASHGTWYWPITVIMQAVILASLGPSVPLFHQECLSPQWCKQKQRWNGAWPTSSSTTVCCIPAPVLDLVGVCEGREYFVDVVADVEQTLASARQLVRLRLVWCVGITEVLQRPLYCSHTILALDTHTHTQTHAHTHTHTHRHTHTRRQCSINCHRSNHSFS